MAERAARVAATGAALMTKAQSERLGKTVGDLGALVVIMATALLLAAAVGTVVGSSFGLASVASYYSR